MARTSSKRSSSSTRTKSAAGKSSRSTGAARGRSARSSSSTSAKKTTMRGRGAAKSTGTKRLSKSARPHKITTSGRKIFEPIDMTPTERKEAGEKLPAYIKNTGKPWEPADIKQLKTLAKGNTPTRVIGMKLGRSESSIRAKARTEEISLKPANRSPYGTSKK